MEIPRVTTVATVSAKLFSIVVDCGIGSAGRPGRIKSSIGFVVLPGSVKDNLSFSDKIDLAEVFFFAKSLKRSGNNSSR